MSQLGQNREHGAPFLDFALKEIRQLCVFLLFFSVLFVLFVFATAESEVLGSLAALWLGACFWWIPPNMIPMVVKALPLPVPKSQS